MVDSYGVSASRQAFISTQGEIVQLTQTNASLVTQTSRINVLNSTILTFNNLTLAQIAANIGNWTLDKISYASTSWVTDYIGAMSNLTLSQISANLGNWTLDKPNYATINYANGINNLTYALIVTNIGNFSAENSSLARIGDCASGEVVQNTTTGGVQCVPLVAASTTYYVNATYIVGGTITSTKLNDSYWYDGITYNVSEGNGGEPLTLYLNYTNVTTFSQWVVREYYLGSSSHNIQFEIYDYTLSGWESYFNVVGQTGQTIISIPVFDSTDHVNGGVVQTRLRHIENGITSHRLYIDFAWLVEGNNIGASTNLGGYAKYLFGYNNFVGSGNFSTTGAVNASSYIGLPVYNNGTSNLTLSDISNNLGNYSESQAGIYINITGLQTSNTSVWTWLGTNYINVTGLQTSNTSIWTWLGTNYINVTELQASNTSTNARITSVNDTLNTLIGNVSTLGNYSADKTVLYLNITGLNTTKVPYTGATEAVNLGTYNITAQNYSVTGSPGYISGNATCFKLNFNSTVWIGVGSAC